jgi:uncharacterized membrane protein YesL
MSNFFNMENPIFSFLGKVCDVLFLSVIFVLFCIPVITIGPANTALYYATVKVIRRERGYLFREFFKSFKLNFKQGAILGIILTVMYVIIAFDLYAAWTSLGGTNSVSSILFGIYIAIAIILLCFSLYIYPVLSRFEMPMKQLIKIVFFMSIKHLPSTIAMLVVQVAAILGVILIPPLIFIVPALVTLINSLLMERIFKKYTPKAEGEEEEAKKDEWYLE